MRWVKRWRPRWAAAVAGCRSRHEGGGELVPELERGRERDDRVIKLLKAVAPGTLLREALENILRARTGALIVVADSPQIMALVDGGFRIDAELTHAALYELAKMDGAIILSGDARRILYANAQLVPDAAIPATETGIRHRTAERVAKQTGELVIAISQRRNIISLYKGALRYVLRDTSLLLSKSSQALQTLERYRTVLNQALVNLSAMELEDLVTVSDVALVLQRTEMALRVVREIDRYISELGTEGRLVQMQLDELVANLAEEGRLIVMDYLQQDEHRTVETVLDSLAGSAEILDLASISRLLGYGSGGAAMESPVTARGYRLMRKVPRLPMAVIENIIGHFGSLPPILRASTEELDEVDGIGEARAKAIKDGLRRLREQTMLERTV